MYTIFHHIIPLLVLLYEISKRSRNTKQIKKSMLFVVRTNFGTALPIGNNWRLTAYVWTETDTLKLLIQDDRWVVTTMCMSKSYMRSKHPMKSWSQQIWAWYLFTYLVTLVEIIWIESSAIPDITTIADLQFLTSKAGIWIKFELEDILYWQQLRWLAKPLLYTSSSLHRVGNTVSFQVSCYFDSADNFSIDYHTCDGDVTAPMIF